MADGVCMYGRPRTRRGHQIIPGDEALVTSLGRTAHCHKMLGTDDEDLRVASPITHPPALTPTANSALWMSLPLSQMMGFTKSLILVSEVLSSVAPHMLTYIVSKPVLRS